MKFDSIGVSEKEATNFRLGSFVECVLKKRNFYKRLDMITITDRKERPLHQIARRA